MFTPKTGKVEAYDGASQSQGTPALSGNYSDGTTTDAVATAIESSDSDGSTPTTDSSSGTTQDSAYAADSADPSFTTTTSDSSSDGGAAGSVAIVVTGAVPEPSTLITAGSMFLAYGLVAFASRKRA